MNYRHHISSPRAIFICILLTANIFAKTNEIIVGTIVSIHDGDTLTVLTTNKVQYKVRLNGIDAPELGQAFGTKAKQALSNKIFGKSAKIVVTDIDHYNRLVGDVFIDETSVNREMVAEGWAWHYLQYSKSATLAKKETYARQNQLGLWHDIKPVPPWEFRKRDRGK